MAHGGWTRAKRLAFEQAFYDFLGEAKINSKDDGEVILGDHLYRAQRMFFTTIFDGLEQDIHTFDALKSRQLGISTSTRALTVFWLGMHDGLSGACVFDSDQNRQNARDEIVDMLEALPESLGFPVIKSNNRGGLALENNSRIRFLSAGQSKRSGGNALGASLGLTVAHLSELCSYGDDAGLEAFQHSLSEKHPNRLYIRESTARGFNIWNNIWEDDRKDPHVRCCFLGWWSKDSQVIERHEADFERYGLQPPTDVELKKITRVKELYGYDITQEQVAWVRRKMKPSAEAEGDAPLEYEGDPTRVQEQPWTEDEAFQQTGATFFTPENLTVQANEHMSRKFEAYMFNTGLEFHHVRVHRPPNQKFTELKVWEQPQEESTYVISCDPAFGSHEDNDRSAIQVLRCYADGCDQVAEYAWPLIGTRPLAWILLSICGWYAGRTSDVYLIVELNGPGGAVWDEIIATRHMVMTGGYHAEEIEASGLGASLANVRNYIYGRSDSMASGKAWQWRTSSGGAGLTSKVRVMERLRDFTDNGMLHIRSEDTLKEMNTVTREGDTIKAQGRAKDDRVMSLGLGIRCWEERVRKTMVSMQRTRDREYAKVRLTPMDRYKMFTSYQFQAFLGEKKLIRDRQARALRAAQRRNYR